MCLFSLLGVDLELSTSEQQIYMEKGKHISDKILYLEYSQNFKIK